MNRYRCEHQPVGEDGSDRHKFRTFKGYIWIDEYDIMGCKAEGNYTEVFLTTGNQETVIVQLGKLQQILSSPLLFRSHRSALINIRYLHSFDRKTQRVKLICGGHEVVLPVTKEKMRELEGK